MRYFKQSLLGLLQLSGSPRTLRAKSLLPLIASKGIRIRRLVLSCLKEHLKEHYQKEKNQAASKVPPPLPLFLPKGSPLKHAPGSPQNPAPEMAGENMDLLSDSLAQLRRFSAASHHGSPDDLSGGPQARLRRPLP